jgi:phosphoglycerate dehydrogenase-like enzyme
VDLPTVVFSDINIVDSMQQSLENLFARSWVINPKTNTPNQIQSAKEVAVAWISRSQPLTRADLARMTYLKIISVWGVGYNHIDLIAATDRSIPVCINPVFSRSMAEGALTLMLALAKRLPFLSHCARSGNTPGEFDRGIEIRNRKLGIIGFGRIGKEIGELADRLGMQVFAYDPYLSVDNYPIWCQSVSLNQLLSSADFVVVTAPLTNDTYHMIGTTQLAMMKPSAYLINISRGQLIDEVALLEALHQGQIAGAGLDVWENEPLDPANHILTLENVIPTPHRIGATWESLDAVCQAIQSNVLRVLDGESPVNVVNPQIYENSNKGISR